MLLEVGRPAEALEAFGQALARNANRTRSVLGSARAASALGQTDAAREHYQRVLANYEHADPGLKDVAEARAALAALPAAQPQPVASGTDLSGSLSTPRIAAGLAGLVALAGVLLAVRYRKAGRRAPAKALPVQPAADVRRRKGQRRR